MTEKDWTERLRKQMADYEAPVPDGLWAGIEQQLATQRKAATVSLWRRWAAVAAVAVLAISGGTYWVMKDSTMEPTLSALPSIQHRTSAEAPESKGLAEPTSLAKATHADTPPTVAIRAKSAPVAALMTGLEAPASEQNTSIAATLPDTMPSAKTEAPVRQPAASTTSQPTTNRQPVRQPAVRQQPPKALPPVHHRELTIGLYASNGLQAYHNANGVQMNERMINSYNFSDYMPKHGAPTHEPVYLTGYEEQQHHDQPVSFGLSVGYPLSSHWSLLAGVTYTRLSSKFVNTIQHTQLTKQQVLHYVGIPLNLSYTIWSNRQVKAYAMAGIEADWNIQARLTTEGVSQDMSKDRLQWSAGGAVGVEYRPLPLFGFYVEPGVRYYFDNHSPVQNYFKDKPTAWSLQLGLRLNIGKP